MPTSGQRGLDMLLKINTGTDLAPVFTTVAAIQSKNFGLNQEVVEITNQDSPNRWRELLSGAGNRKANISGSGMATPAGAAILYAAWAGGVSKQCQVIVPGLGTFTGPYMIPKLDFKGPHDKEVTFDINLESAGEVVMTA
jgi:TP901-1 family phage major tail protein